MNCRTFGQFVLYLCISYSVFSNVCHGNPIALDVDIWNEAETFQNESTQRHVDQNSTSRNAKVLNFFPIPVEEECNANDGRRKGICMNPYECRMQSGTSKGTCALGFGVCCVSTCNQDAYNNLTYFTNPNFPDLSKEINQCTLKIKKIDAEIVQLKLDFVHFNLGQPNRRTGVCEEDVFVMAGGNTRELTLCGINSGQHVFFDVDDTDEAIVINMNMSRKTVSRLWEIRITQIPFAQRAPEGCLQYHTGHKGVLQTMNFAENGRHLANQDYNICMRQEEGMCAIAYEPCDEDSFKIGNTKPHGAHIQYFDNNQNVVSTASTSTTSTSNNDVNNHGNDQLGSQSEASQQTENELDVADGGSGDGRDGSFKDDDMESRMMEICTDRILLPCDNEDFLLPTGVPASTSTLSGGYCSLSHCGSSLCLNDNSEQPCRVESNVVPFTVGVQFGASGRDDSPEDNIGMCLTYQQQPCVV